MKRFSILFTGLLLVLWAALPQRQTTAAENGQAGGTAETEITGLSPAEVAVEALRPGLLPVYYFEFFRRDVRELPKSMSSEFRTETGAPILEINHQFGSDNVFDSGASRGVGLRLSGFVRFAEPGSYALQALSNDGVIVTIDGAEVISDPEQHSDRLSPVGIVHIDEPGYYPFGLEYFQRKGTAALKLFWKRPGESAFAPVPPEAYFHRP